MNQEELIPGTPYEGLFIVVRKSLLTTRQGNPYGVVVLMREGMEVEGKVWDGAEGVLGEINEGMVVRVRGQVEQYQGRIQLVVGSIVPVPDVAPAELMPRAPVPEAELTRRLVELVRWVNHKGLRQLLEGLFIRDKEFWEAFRQAPAAKAAHHAYVGGLLEHTVGVAEAAKAIARCYPQLDGQLLVAGALVHDIGKVRELSLGPPIDYTPEGRMLGHLVMGAQMLEERLGRVKALGTEVGLHLKHMILSHHGHYEFASPRRPKTAEALVLHLLDDMDAKLAMFREAAQGAGGPWSDYHRLLERYLYVGPSPLQPDNSEPTGHQPHPIPGLFDGHE